MHTYYRYSGADPAPGALIITFYHSGDQIRGFIRKVAEPSEADMIFPGEEMEPEAAFRMAESKSPRAAVPSNTRSTWNWPRGWNGTRHGAD